MTLQEKIQKKAEEYGEHAPIFLEGANFALENQWISIKDDLPCNHEELLLDTNQTNYVEICYTKGKYKACDTTNMIKEYDNGRWKWKWKLWSDKYLTHWKLRTEPPK